MGVKCIIIDDEPVAVRVLKHHLLLFPEFEIVDTFSNAPLALAFLRTHKVDLIFLDIEMPLMNGIEFLGSLTCRPSVIFTTAYREYGVEAYDFDVVYYLLKPISVERLGRALSRFHEIKGSRVVQNADHIQDVVTYLNIKSNKETLRLATDNIFYFQSCGDYVKCFHSNGRTIIRDRISNFEKSLPGNQFVRIHRQYIVSMKWIVSIRGNLLRLNDIDLPIGRQYRSEVKLLIG
jgi:two-component system, LytTR family, response regulator